MSDELIIIITCSFLAGFTIGLVFMGIIINVVNPKQRKSAHELYLIEINKPTVESKED